MNEEWIFTYYGCFGKGDSSDEIEYEAEVSSDEYDFLNTLTAYENGDLDDDFDVEEYILNNKELADELKSRVQAEIKETEADNWQDNNYDEDGEMPEIRANWIWENI